MQEAMLDGLAVPTFFVNQIVAMRTIGPCVEFFLGAISDDAKGVMMPEICLIMPREDASEATKKAIDFLRAVAAENVLVLRVRN